MQLRRPCSANDEVACCTEPVLNNFDLWGLRLKAAVILGGRGSHLFAMRTIYTKRFSFLVLRTGKVLKVPAAHKAAGLRYDVLFY